MKRFGILAAALAIMSSPAQAQFVSSVSVDREMKRLGQACMAYAEVGKTGMPDFSKAGYKLQKQGLGGKKFFAYTSLSAKKVDASTLKKGTGLSGMIDWHTGQGHICFFTIGLRLEQDMRYAQKLESSFMRRSVRLGTNTLKRRTIAV